MNKRDGGREKTTKVSVSFSVATRVFLEERKA
jgi:hypothetical protein